MQSTTQHHKFCISARDVRLLLITLALLHRKIAYG
jgi:hypothetical protein